MKRFSIIMAIIFITLFTFAGCNSAGELEPKVISIDVDSFASYELYQGDNLDLTDATILVKYDNGETKLLPITEQMIANFSKTTIGKQTISIKYLNFEKKVDIFVKNVEIASIAVEKAPKDYSVVQGNDLDVRGISLRVNYQNKYTILDHIDSTMVSGYSKTMEPGEYQLTITFAGFTTTTKLTILPKAIVSISINERPTDTYYFLSTALDPSGLQITVLYDNKSTRTVAYSEENKNDFKFTYNFETELPAAPVKVTYLADYEAMFTVVVSAPKCIRVEFEYDESVLDTTTGETTIVKRLLYPQSYGFSINGAERIPCDLNKFIEGDRINWASGKAYLTFDDGSNKIISLSDNGIGVRRIDEKGQDVDAKAMVFTKPMQYTLFVKYGNMAQSASLYVTVHSKAAHELLLYNTQEITQKSYVAGDIVVPDLIRYNVLYNNGSYKFTKDNYNDWQTVRVEDMLSNTTSLTCSYNAQTGGVQTITFETEGVSKAVDINVKQLEVVSMVVTAPIQNNVLKGSASISLTGSGAYVVYNNQKQTTIALTSEMLTIYKGATPIGTPIIGNLNDLGDYTVVVTYLNVSSSFQITVVEAANFVTKLEVINIPSETPKFFDVVAFQSTSVQTNITFKVTYATGITSDITALDAELYYFDDCKIGYQDIGYRYGGFIAWYPINIIGRQVNNIIVLAAPKVLFNLGEQFSIAGLKIEKSFNDGTKGEVYDFPPSEWLISSPDMTTVGAKTISIKYGKLTATYQIHVEISAVENLTFSTAQQGMVNGELVVTFGDDINVTGLALGVKYANSTQTISVPLARKDVAYDKNLNQLGSRNLVITFGNKQAQLPIKVVAADARTLTRIEILHKPTRDTYVNGQQLNLEGGYITRYFADGTSDIMPMIGQVDTTYDPIYFDNNNNGNGIKVQDVMVTYRGKTANMSITTYEKTTVDNYISYQDIVSFYGTVKTPKIIISLPSPMFVAPDYTMEYMVDGSWTSARPNIPGKYAIKVIVIGNEYYNSSEIATATFTITQKIIQIKANNLEKYYGQKDPTLTYWTEGDIVVDGKVVKNTALVINGDVQDKIVISLVRERGENVILNSTGVEIGYRITMKLDNSIAQNSRYILDYREATLVIKKTTITQKIKFNGANNLIEDGANKVITASYVVNGIDNHISASDITYRDSDGNILKAAPVKAGTYTATINSNNYIVAEDNKSITFTISRA